MCAQASQGVHERAICIGLMREALRFLRDSGNNGIVLGATLQPYVFYSGRENTLKRCRSMHRPCERPHNTLLLLLQLLPECRMNMKCLTLGNL